MEVVAEWGEWRCTISDAEDYLAKALENLAAAQSDQTAGRYNTCASRAYYACFLAAIVALIRADLRATSGWRHDFVASRFVGVLIGQRHLYDRELRGVLSDLIHNRHIADYASRSVSKSRAESAVRAAIRFVEAVQRRGSRQ
ncbi:MAG TPA: HEPN domain-containing protein [Dehalococcoidia bacterium]|nr:HEPN domain-containing protein [Dehalococcoidia bacterium]